MAIGCFILATVTLSSVPPASSNAVVTPLPVGQYLDPEYIKRTMQSLSPLKAQMDLALEVRNEATGQMIVVIENFHEGVLIWHRDTSGNLSIDPNNLGSGVNRTNTIKEVQPSRGEIVLGLDKPIVFKFVKDGGAYIAERILVGSYRDSKNRLYVFKKDGKAIFPNTQFQFALGLDFIMNRFDYIMVTGTSTVYGYKRTPHTLELFHTSDDTINEDDEPFVRLERQPD